MAELGRPSEYSEEYIDKVDHYLAQCEDTLTERGKLQVRLPTIEGFSIYLGVSKKSLYNWRDKHPDFLHALEKIETEQKERLLNMGLSGDYNPTIAKLVLSANHNMREKTEQDITSQGQQLGVVILPPKNNGNTVETTTETSDSIS